MRVGLVKGDVQPGGGSNFLNRTGGGDTVARIFIDDGDVFEAEVVFAVQILQKLDLRVAELAALGRNLEGIFVAQCGNLIVHGICQNGDLTSFGDRQDRHGQAADAGANGSRKLLQTEDALGNRCCTLGIAGRIRNDEIDRGPMQGLDATGIVDVFYCQLCGRKILLPGVGVAARERVEKRNIDIFRVAVGGP